MPGVGLLTPELAVQFTNAYVRISAMIVPNPFQFFIGMSVGVRSVRSVRLCHQRFFCPVILLVPPHKGRFENVIPAAHKADVFRLPVQSYSSYFRRNFMWQITFYL